jgi:PAS domain S-box-containing protein
MESFTNRTPKFWTYLICSLFASVIISAAFVTNALRNTQYQSRYDHIYAEELNTLEKTKAELMQQALMTAQLVEKNRSVTELLVQASISYQNSAPEQELRPIREQLSQIVSPYWQYLHQQGVKQLHFHLAPQAFTLYRAHKPEFHSDVLADVRPLVVEVLKTGQAFSGLEIGRNGLGLRAVVPVSQNNKVIAAIEVGYGLSGALSSKQSSLPDKSTQNSGIAFVINKTLLEVMTDDQQAKFNAGSTLFWSTEDSSLQETALLQHIPEKVNSSAFLSVQQDGRTFLLTLMPWPEFKQSGSEAGVVLVNWLDITSMQREKSRNDWILNIIWLIALLMGLASVYTISTKLQKSTARFTEQRQKELLWSEKKLRALFDLSPDSILLNRLSDGIYLEANPAMEKLTGYNFEELQQLSYFDLTPETFAAQEQEQLRQLNETGRYGPYRKQYRHKNGHLVDIELRGVKFVSPSGEEMIWSTITDLTETLKLDRLKQDFISTVSHELRTPLTSINGSLDLLLSGAAGELPAKAEKLLGIAVKNNKRLIALVNDLLDMEKLSQGKLAFHTQVVSSALLLQSAVELNQSFAQQHKVELKLGQTDDVLLHVDPARIQQVLANLISNAAKFSPQGSIVSVYTVLQPQVLRIAVADQGRGLTAEQISRLFQRFSQLDNVNNREKAGSGLGLAISRDIISQSNGQIGVDSEYGAGSTFWIELPLVDKTVQPALTRKILIVEDDADTAFTIQELLTANGYSADVAHTLEQAWFLLHQRDYDLISLDLNLNGESGSDFFLRLRDSSDYAHLPVLVISAYIHQGKLALNAIANTVDWLEKPVDSERLFRKIEYLLAQSNSSSFVPRILHIEDDEDIVSILKMQLEPRYQYHQAASIVEARSKLRINQYDLVLLDIGLPDGEGWQLFPDLELLQGKVPVIIFSAQDISVNQQNQATAVFGKTKIQPSALVQHIAQMLNARQP